MPLILFPYSLSYMYKNIDSYREHCKITVQVFLPEDQLNGYFFLSSLIDVCDFLFNSP